MYLDSLIFSGCTLCCMLIHALICQPGEFVNRLTAPKRMDLFGSPTPYGMSQFKRMKEKYISTFLE